MEPFQICFLFYNNPAWYDVTTDDNKSYDLTRYHYKAYQQAPPAEQIFMYKNLGKWEHNTGIFYDPLVQEIGALIENARK